MVSHIKTVALEGLSVTTVNVQVHIISAGQPSFTIVGLGDKAIAESKERVRASIGSIGLSLPHGRITVNLAPADLTKEGSHYDLAIALGILASMEVFPDSVLQRYFVVGELALDGVLMPVMGTLPVAMKALEEDMGVICPEHNSKEAAWSGNEDILPVTNLLALVNHLKGITPIHPAEAKPPSVTERQQDNYADFSEVKGQETVKRALEIAAAGGHHVLMIGPPGSGKSMLASRFPGILPPLSVEEMLESSMIASISGHLQDSGVLYQRPYRNPHHSCSTAAMVGGGKTVRPGEISLAHHGVLFLDELPEFPRPVLEALRQPIENSTVTIARAQSHVTYPAKFQLIAAMNPCRCGFLNDVGRACDRAPRCGVDYQTKISGPILDRMDIVIEVPRISPIELEHKEKAESSAAIRKRVLDARSVQAKRYTPHGITINAYADGEILVNTVSCDPEGKRLLNHAASQFGLSMRGYNRVLRVARTIADLAVSEVVMKSHIAEALHYRLVGIDGKKQSRISA